MYAYINGIITEINQDNVVIEAGGIGYCLLCTGSVLSSVKINETIKIYTYYHVREDAISLFGFSSKEERTMFLRLLSVSGIGPKIGLQILTAISARELAIALVSGDTTSLTRVPGVGKKTAQRLILELREKVDNDELLPQTTVSAAGKPSFAADAIYALAALGYSPAEASKAVEAVALNCTSTEEIIRLVLKNMDRR